MNILLIAVIDGDRVVAEVELAEKDGVQGYNLDRPAVIILSPDENKPGNAKFTFGPYEPLADRDSKVFMPMTSIMHIVEPQEPIKMGYAQATNRIVTPPKSGLITP